MTRGLLLFAGALGVLAASLAANLSVGASGIGPAQVFGALFRFDPDDYDHYIILHQRLPRALIGAYVGAVMATAGAVLQGLTRNPLAAPSTLGVSAGATLAVIATIRFADPGTGAQGIAALAGGAAGFGASLAVARLVGLSHDRRGLALILSGALVSMLLIGMANALLLSDPPRRSELLGWITGDINHAYVERLAAFWWLGALSVIALIAMARPLTLIALGAERAAAAGVSVGLVSALALGAVTAGSASAVAICGPIGFVGLVVPHLVRPITGAAFARLLPVCAVTGAAICLLADLIARSAFAPFTLHTGVVMDLVGGIVFILIVKRYYLGGRVAA